MNRRQFGGLVAAATTLGMTRLDDCAATGRAPFLAHDSRQQQSGE